MLYEVITGAITELIYHEGMGTPPAILFDQIPGYSKGFKTLFGATCSPERMALTMGFPESRITSYNVCYTKLLPGGGGIA